MNTQLIDLDLLIRPIVMPLDGVSILVAAVIGYVGILVMTYGAVHGAWLFIRAILQHKTQKVLPLIRIELGKHLALGLEFLVGKDIIESIVNQTWDDLKKLAVIIALRTVVAYILSWEIRNLQKEIEAGRMEEDEL